MNSELEREALALPEPYAYIEIDAVKGTIICVDKQSPTTVEVWTRSQIETALSTEAQPEVTGAVYVLKDKLRVLQHSIDLHVCLHKTPNHNLRPASDFTPLYPQSAIEAAVREKLEEAAALVIRQLGVEHGEILADDILALMESPHPSVEEPAK